jgi:hypothetical protein
MENEKIRERVIEILRKALREVEENGVVGGGWNETWKGEIVVDEGEGVVVSFEGWIEDEQEER